MDIIINLVCSSIMAVLAYKVTEELNKKDTKLELNPVVHGAIGFLFGICGLCGSAAYIAYKSYKLNK